MNKYIILSIFALIIYQNAISQRWEHFYGNPGTDESFRDIIEYYDIGYLLSNYKESPQANWILKTDVNGNILWNKLLQWQDAFISSGYIDQKNGNTIVASSINSESIGYWPMITRIDSCGEKVWCRIIPKNEYMLGYYRDVLVLDNGDYLALAHFEGEYHWDQLFLDYIDYNGDVVWRKPYASMSNYPVVDQMGNNLQKYNNNYYISGYCYYDYPGPPTHFYLTPMFVCIDSAYNEKWMLPIGVSDSLHGETYDLTFINDSLLLGAGWGYEGSSILSLLMIFNTDGNEINYKKIPNESIGYEVKENLIRKILKINDSLYLAVGFWGNEEIYSGGELIIDTSGNIYNKQFRLNAIGSPSVVKTYDSNFVIGRGYREGTSDWDVLLNKIDDSLQSVPFDTNQYNYDSLCPHPITSGTIDLSDCVVWTDTEEIPTPEEYYANLRTIPIKTFPSPAKDKITFALENTDKHRNILLQCYDIFGRQVHEQKVYTGQLEAEADVSKWGKGIYVVVVKSNGKVVGKSKFIVE